MKVVGLDGYKNGWVAVFIDGDKRSLVFLKSLDELQLHSCDFAMIDIPIGLPATGNRECDLLAKRLLKTGSSRVFTGARRNYWKFSDRLTAHQYYKSMGDKGISCQLWCIRDKIIEADNFITSERQNSLRETHPELAFWRLNGQRVLPPKKTPDGVLARTKLLRGRGFDDIDNWVDQKRLGTGAKADDILDACGCALVALNPTHRIPVRRQGL